MVLCIIVGRFQDKWVCVECQLGNYKVIDEAYALGHWRKRNTAIAQRPYKSVRDSPFGVEWLHGILIQIGSEYAVSFKFLLNVSFVLFIQSLKHIFLLEIVDLIRIAKNNKRLDNIFRNNFTGLLTLN